MKKFPQISMAAMECCFISESEAMNFSKRTQAGLILVWLIYSILIIHSAESIPFHPDESTQIYMSGDLKVFFTHPESLFYDPSQPVDSRTRYRLLDAPLTRWLIGISQTIFSIPPQDEDWNWSEDFQQNLAAGAVPSPKSLNAARLPSVILFCLSIVFIYKIGADHFQRPILGLAAAIFIAVNPLLLLHGRRAMAEGALLCFTVFFLWVCTRVEINPYLLAVAASLAFNAKQTAAILIIIGLIVLVIQGFRSSNWKKSGQKVIIYLVVITLTTFFLNPSLWSHPIQAAQASINSRIAFSTQQAAEFRLNGSALAVDHPLKGILVLIWQLIFAPLAYFDTLNYAAELAPFITAYQKGFLSVWFSGTPWSILSISLLFLGLLPLLKKNRRGNTFQIKKAVAICGVIVLAFLLLAVPIGFQRYYILLYPFFALGVGAGADLLISTIFQGHLLQKPDK